MKNQIDKRLDVLKLLSLKKPINMIIIDGIELKLSGSGSDRLKKFIEEEKKVTEQLLEEIDLLEQEKK